MENITKEQWKEQLKNDSNAVIIDVRTPMEWAEGVMPNALKIDVSSPAFEAKIQELDKSKNYYVYCRSGGRSGQACMYMDSMGFNTTYNLVGGMMSWDGEVVEG